MNRPRLLLAMLLVLNLAAWRAWLINPQRQPVSHPGPAGLRRVATGSSRVNGSVSTRAGAADQTAATTVSDVPTARMVLARLQAWEDADNSRDREQRLQELDRWLSGSNAWEIVQSLPADYLGYAFAAPGFRQRLLADPAATLAWMEAHPEGAGQVSLA